MNRFVKTLSCAVTAQLLQLLPLLLYAMLLSNANPNHSEFEPL